MRRLMFLAVVLLSAAAATPATAQVGYIYDAPSLYPRPPVYGYGAYGLGGYRYGGFLPPAGLGAGYGAYYRFGRPLPPYGFGSPYYSGYNDPYFHSYGPGVQEFLYFGGADFYGW